MFYDTKHILDSSTVISVKEHISEMNFASVIRTKSTLLGQTDTEGTQINCIQWAKPSILHTST